MKLKEEQQKLSSNNDLQHNAQNISKNQVALKSEQQDPYHDTLQVMVSEDISSYDPKSAITPCINEDTLNDADNESIYTSNTPNELEEEV
jgi:hypothetical protein